MTIRKTIRCYRYSGLLLPDPAPDLDVESVRSFYAASYPEITTAALTGPEAVDGTLVYTFTKAIEGLITASTTRCVDGRCGNEAQRPACLNHRDWRPAPNFPVSLGSAL